MDLSDRPALVPASRLLAAVQAVVPPARVLVVGAAARDWLLAHAHGIPVARATEDVDLALEVQDWQEFHQFRAGLLRHGGFSEVPRILHRLRHPNHGLLDLVPFGPIEEEDGSILWPPPMHGAMNMLGFIVAARSAVQVRLPEGVQANVVPLPMLAILKVLSWEDRHLKKPLTDAPDLFFILRNYEDAGNQNRLYEEFQNLTEDPHFDVDYYSAWLAGHDARILLELAQPGSARVRDQVLSVLERETDAEGALKLIADGRGIGERSRLLGLLQNFARGLRGLDSLAG